MKFTRLQLLSFLLSLSLLSSAKDLNLAIAYTEFMNEENENYLELYFALDTRSLEYGQTENGLWYGGLEITVSLSADSVIKAADRFRIKVDPAEDTTTFANSLINQIRLPLGSQPQWLTLHIQSLVDPTKKTEIKQMVKPLLGSADLSSSQLLLLESFDKTEEKTSFSKSGYELVPLVNSGSHYFDEQRDELSFYLEVYNSHSALQNEPFLLRYFLRDYDTQKDLKDYASFSKKESSEVVPLLASFNIAQLPTGNYELVVELLNKEGEKLLGESVFFYRNKRLEPIDPSELENVEVSQSFAQFLGNEDSLRLFIDYLYPITTDRQRKAQQSMLAQSDPAMMRRYFYSFWQRLYPLDPAQAWLDYKEAVELVNEKYRSQLRPGYKTDRGRIYLKYGAPSMVETRSMDPQSPPYELWQYNRINSKFAIPQVNRFFVFADIDRGTRIFELLHSTALGEKQSNRWRQELGFKAYGGTMNQDQSGYSDQDGFGSRLNNNLILQGTGADQNRRTQ